MPTLKSAKQNPLKGIIEFEFFRYEDPRGYFCSPFNQKEMSIYIDKLLVQQNESYSVKNVVRGLHYQRPRAQGKLVRVIYGEILDVAIDLSESSKNFGKHAKFVLSSEKNNAIYIPDTFAHGFIVKSDFAIVSYMATDFYFPDYEHCIRYDDATLAIDWETESPVIVSDKDSNGRNFLDAVYHR